ncbi:MAG TPA: inositol monophosphatase [Devosiaceae bacterium]
MSGFDIAEIAEILREAAKAEVLPRFRRLEAGMVRQKSSAVDLVTEADVAAEHRIAAAVAAVVPDALFVGEEAASADPSLLDGLADAQLAVVVDPIDGTGNFAAGLPLFGVMAAVVANGETVAGVIYDPMGDDWVIAEKGAGAWQTRPDGSGHRLEVSGPAPLEEMVGAVSWHALAPRERARVVANLDKVRIAASYRCAAHDYRTFAAGHLHFVMHAKLMPWDHLAGALISREAGAYVARMDGSPYLPRHREGGLLLATDRESWVALRSEVFTV